MANGGIIGPVVSVTATTNIGSNVNASYGDLKLLCENILNNSNPGSATGVWSLNEVFDFKKAGTWVSSYTDNEPTAGGTQTVNSVSMGSYDFVRKPGQTISSFTYSDYFTDTNDSRSSIIVFDGNVTIDSGVTIVPRNRKLFTCIYVNGDLAVNGAIEMTLRGANHSSGSGSNISSGAIKIAPGPFSPSVTDPNVPATGGAGGAGSSNNITGSCVSYAGGGGGGSYGTGGSGGTGGGGAGGSAGGSATAGTANTGGGGGGTGSAPTGGAGGSGIVIVRVPSSTGISVSPCTNTVTNCVGPANDKVAKFTVSGTLTVS